MSLGDGKTEIVSILTQVPLFSDLDRKALNKLAKLCVPKQFPAGALIVEEGKSGLGLFVINRGRAEVYKNTGESKLTLAMLTDGDIVGEMSLVDDAPRSATCVAVDATDCLLITRESFRSLVSNNADIAWCIVPVLANRVRTLNERLERNAVSGHETVATATAEKTIEEKETDVKAADPSSINSERLYHLFWSEYALLRAGLEGMRGSIGVADTFLNAVAVETTQLANGRFNKLIKALPGALRAAAGEALVQGERLPEKMVSTFRRERRRR